MSFAITHMFRGIGGEFEVQRVLGALGTTIYTLITPIFVATGIIENVSVTEFSLAYPAGLAACIGATAGSIALKDRNVATAQATVSKTKTDASAADAKTDAIKDG